jgi:hypothetical protein
MKPAYTVIWKPSLIESVIPAYLTAAIEQGRSIRPITDAMNEIDRLLGARPESVGESRAPPQRVLFCRPCSSRTTSMWTNA